MNNDNNISKIRLLIVDDDAMVIRIVKDMLSVLGFSNFEVARDGKDALDVLKLKDIDIIICDWKMKPMDGLEFTRSVREKLKPPARFVPIIMLTGKNEKRDVESARDAGISEYLIKPFTAQGLSERIKRVVEKPRPFILTKQYRGPDRRRSQKEGCFPTERRKRPHSYE